MTTIIESPFVFEFLKLDTCPCGGGYSGKVSKDEPGTVISAMTVNGALQWKNR